MTSPPFPWFFFLDNGSWAFLSTDRGQCAGEETRPTGSSLLFSWKKGSGDAIEVPHKAWDFSLQSKD